MTDTETQKQRFQFGIRTILILVLIASFPLAWVAYDVQKSRDRDAVEREWNRRGANVNFAPDRRIVWLGYRSDAAAGITDDDLKYLEEALDVEYLDLRDTAITDAGLSKLRPLKKLYGVNLAGTEVTNDGLHHFYDMTLIRVLDLTRTNVTADGVEQFKTARPDCEVVH